MLFTTPLSLVVPLLTALTSSLPTSSPEPYMCGYVLTRHNSSAYASISALDACAPFYYNETNQDYQDAFAYKLFGGCECGFFGSWEKCVDVESGHENWIAGPTDGNEEIDFEGENKAWYQCRKD